MTHLIMVRLLSLMVKRCSASKCDMACRAVWAGGKMRPLTDEQGASLEHLVRVIQALIQRLVL